MTTACTDRCLVRLCDGSTVCAVSVARAYPDGIGPQRLANLLGYTRQGIDVLVSRALHKLVGPAQRRGVAL